MVKIKNKRELKHYLQQHEQNKITIKQAANHLKITPRRFKQLYHQHKTTNRQKPRTTQKTNHTRNNRNHKTSLPKRPPRRTISRKNHFRSPKNKNLQTNNTQGLNQIEMRPPPTQQTETQKTLDPIRTQTFPIFGAYGLASLCKWKIFVHNFG